MIRGLSSLILSGSTVLLVQCTPVLQGPPVDVATLGKPDLSPEPAPAPRTAPTPASMPPIATGAIRAWMPRTVSPNGDVTDGHYLDISPAAPRQEVTAPDKPIPRPPKGALPPPAVPKQKAGPAGPGGPPLEPRLPERPPLPRGSPGFPDSGSVVPPPEGGSYAPLVP